MAEPSAIVMTFLDQQYENYLRPDFIACRVDAEAIFAHVDGDEPNELFHSAARGEHATHGHKCANRRQALNIARQARRLGVVAVAS